MFREEVLNFVKKIPKGKVLTYKEVAAAVGSPRAYRAVARVLAQNKDLRVPCHRVVRSDFLIAGYKGSRELAWQKAALLLKEGLLVVADTDTLPGLLGSALNPGTVARIYKLRKRNPQKPMIILIDSLLSLKDFEIDLKSWQRELLSELWPARISVILECRSPRFEYLHRGSNSLVFRIPADQRLRQMITLSGPLVAPSANPESLPPAKTLSEAKKYFAASVLYLDWQNKKEEQASTIVDLRQKPPLLIRKGADFEKWQHFLKRFF